MVFSSRVAAPDFYKSAGGILVVVFKWEVAACAPSLNEMVGAQVLVFST